MFGGALSSKEAALWAAEEQRFLLDESGAVVEKCSAGNRTRQ